MLHPHRTDSGLTIYRSPLLDEIGVPHAFSTRLGGVSPAPFDSLNLGTLGDSALQDDLNHIRENYRRLRQAIGCEDRERCWVHQVHGPAVCDVRPGAAFENGVKADALVIDDVKRVVSIKYADCVPVLLSTADGKKVGAVHAGWRGVVAGVVPAAARRLSELANASVNSFSAAIGPCIGFDRFEVGAEVLTAFVQLFGTNAPIRPAGDKGYVDLREAVRLQLMGVGMTADKIDTTDRCTFRDGAEFFSHRRDAGITGRMAAIIGPRR